MNSTLLKPFILLTALLVFTGCSSVTVNKLSRPAHISIKHRANTDLTVISAHDTWPSDKEALAKRLVILTNDQKLYKITFLNKVLKHSTGNDKEALVVNIKKDEIVAYLSD